MSDDEPESPTVKGEFSLTVTDLLGLGKAADKMSPAAMKIADGLGAVLGAVTDPIRLYLTARAEGAALRHEVSSDVKQLLEVDKLLQNQPELADAIKRRLISTEIRRQINISAASQEAIRIANTRAGGGTEASVDVDFAQEWVEAVKDVSSDDVRSLWARVLAAAPSTDNGRISKPAVELLKQFDRATAVMFRDLTRYMAIVGLPSTRHSRQFKPFEAEIDFNLLDEMGIVGKATPDEWRIPELGIARQFATEERMFALQRTSEVWSFKARAFELANVIFAEGFPPNELEPLDLRAENLTLLAQDNHWQLGISPTTEPYDYRYRVLGPKSDKVDGENAATAITGDGDLSPAGKQILARFAELGRLIYTPQR